MLVCGKGAPSKWQIRICLRGMDMTMGEVEATIIAPRVKFRPRGYIQGVWDHSCDGQSSPVICLKREVPLEKCTGGTEFGGGEVPGTWARRTALRKKLLQPLEATVSLTPKTWQARGRR